MDCYGRIVDVNQKATSDAGETGKRTARPTLRPSAPKTKTGGRKVGADLVVLGSVAILSVYGIGYQRTLAGANAIAAQDSSGIAQASANPSAPATAATAPDGVTAQSSTTLPTVNSPTAAAGAAAPSTVPAATAVPSPIPATRVPLTSPVRPAATATPVPKAGQYRDGTYVGQGFSRHGGIEATVVIVSGKIVSANISDCSTRYPCSAPEPLIPEVVARQAAPMHHISGATDSSNAYHDAVVKALAQAV